LPHSRHCITAEIGGHSKNTFARLDALPGDVDAHWHSFCSVI